MKLTKNGKCKYFTGPHRLLEPGDLLAAAPVVVEGGAPCRVPAWVERSISIFFERILNEISENVSFDSELALAFEIQSFTIAFVVVFFNANF